MRVGGEGMRKHVYSNAAGVRFAKGNGTTLSARPRLQASTGRGKKKREERNEAKRGAFVGPSAAAGSRFFSPEIFGQSCPK